jgi:hypothetical protein
MLRVVGLKRVKVHFREGSDPRSAELLDMIIRQGTLNLSDADIAVIKSWGVHQTDNDPPKLDTVGVLTVTPPESGVCDCGKIEHGRHHMSCPALKPKS